MWILTVLPEWVTHAIFAIGVLGTIAGFILGFVPFVRAYKFAIQVISLLILTLGVYLEGGLADSKEWELRVKEMEAKVAKAEAQSANKNVEIQEKVVEKTKVIREKGRDIIKYVDKWNTKEIIKEVEGPERIRREEVIKYIENCPVPKEFIDLHNQAAELNKAAEAKK
jgi:flagellar biosynthesis component FlhA